MSKFENQFIVACSVSLSGVNHAAEIHLGLDCILERVVKIYPGRQAGR